LASGCVVASYSVDERVVPTGPPHEIEDVFSQYETIDENNMEPMQMVEGFGCVVTSFSGEDTIFKVQYLCKISD
jgi:hypothetical protein